MRGNVGNEKSDGDVEKKGRVKMLLRTICGKPCDPSIKVATTDTKYIITNCYDYNTLSTYTSIIKTIPKLKNQLIQHTDCCLCQFWQQRYYHCVLM